MKSCRFEVSKNVTHCMVVWTFAYKQARKGEWERYACDRIRFRCRIDVCNHIIAPVLDPLHRRKIYNERFV